MDAGLILVALLLAFAGAAMLALANPMHWGAVMHQGERPPARRKRLKGLGTALIVAEIGCLVVRDGWSFGLLLAPLVAGLGIVLVIATLTLRPAALRWLGRLAAGS